MTISFFFHLFSSKDPVHLHFGKFLPSVLHPNDSKAQKLQLLSLELTVLINDDARLREHDARLRERL